MNSAALDRRQFTAGLGGILVAFSLDPHVARGQEPPRLPGSLQGNRRLGAWIRIDADGSATIFTGKVELGQGILTALAADRGRGARSPSRSRSGWSPATPRAPRTKASPPAACRSRTVAPPCAWPPPRCARCWLALAARRLGVGADTLVLADGIARAPDGREIGYGELAAEADLQREADAKVAPKPRGASPHRRQSIPRFDIPAKVTGGIAFVQDIRLPACCTGAWCVRRATAPSSTMSTTRRSKVMQGVVAVVRDGSLPRRRRRARGAGDQGTRGAARRRKMDPGTRAARARSHLRLIRSLPSKDETIGVRRAPLPANARTVEAMYTKPYVAHAALGPSCAVSALEDGRMTVWTHSQGVFPLRGELAKALEMPAAAIRCVHVEGAGCYGHNGADDAAARCGAACARGARASGPPAMDARRRVQVGALRRGDGDAGEGVARRRPHRRLGVRAVEQYPFVASRLHQRHQRAGGLVSGATAADGPAHHAGGSPPAAPTETPSRSTTSRASA